MTEIALLDTVGEALAYVQSVRRRIKAIATLLYGFYHSPITKGSTMTAILIVLGLTVMIAYLAVFVFYWLPKELKDHDDLH